MVDRVDVYFETDKSQAASSIPNQLPFHVFTFHVFTFHVFTFHRRITQDLFTVTRPMTPSQLNIPLACQSVDKVKRVLGRPATRLAHLPPMPRVDVANYSDNIEWVNPEWTVGTSGHTITLATVLDYVANTYGHDGVSDLLAELDHLGGWSGIIPAVFGVPVEEFEAGWHTYLVDEYGIAWEELDD